MTRNQPCSLPELPDVSSTLVTLCQQIPHGAVSTFGDLAEAMGDRSTARWVATEWSEWWSHSSTGSLVPWHRVVRKTGELPKAPLEIQEVQRGLLAREGLKCNEQGLLQNWQPWAGFETTRPLHRLAVWQFEVARQARSVWEGGVPRIIGGVDTSYVTSTDAIAAYVAVDASTGNVVDRRELRGGITFPYISGYLAFRELPLLLKLMKLVETQSSRPDLVLVDGAGSLHPRRCGLAVLFGLLTELPAVGIAKHRLCGRVRDQPKLLTGKAIWDGEEWLGIELDYSQGRRRCDLSVGHRIDLRRAGQVVSQLGTDSTGPLPVVLADQWSRSLVRQIKNPRPDSIEG